jgi:2-methylcitrate dehydratase PrpD
MWRARLRGRIEIGDSAPAALVDETIRSLTRKIEVLFDPSPQAMIPPGDVTVILSDGRRLRRQVSKLKGTPANPMSFAECADKFIHCLAFAKKIRLTRVRPKQSSAASHH